MRRYLLIPLLISAAGCSPLPDLGPTYANNGRDLTPPKLVPIETLLAEADESATDPVQTEKELNARIAALNAKADRLRADPDAL